MTSVKVTGLGAVCANGLTKEIIYDSCANLQSSVQEGGLASLKHQDWEILKQSTAPALHLSKCPLISGRSLQTAIEESGWSAEHLRECGFIFASTTSQIDGWEKDLPLYNTEQMSPARIAASVGHQSLGTPALALTSQFGIQGPFSLIASSCSAGLQALALAFLWIRSGKVKRCIVGGAEINNDLTRIGFSSMRLLSKTVCSPFDQTRSGINLGEASAFLCLEAADLRAEDKWGYVCGVGLGTDAFHPTSPHPEGLGSVSSIKMALKTADLQASQIDWVYSHGTGSPTNDFIEAQVIQGLFPHRPPVTSTKSAHGHTLGVSGILESVLGLMALQKNQILPTFHFQTPDPKIHIQVADRLVNQEVRYF